MKKNRQKKLNEADLRNIIKKIIKEEYSKQSSGNYRIRDKNGNIKERNSIEEKLLMKII